MFSHFVNPALALLISTSLALPSANVPRDAALTESQLVSIAPKSSSCANAAFVSECRTATQAVGPISASFATYNLTTPGEQAAVLATMAFETSDFEYQNNHFPPPGTPGSKYFSLLVLLCLALKGRSKISFGNKRRMCPPDICLAVQLPLK